MIEIHTERHSPIEVAKALRLQYPRCSTNNFWTQISNQHPDHKWCFLFIQMIWEFRLFLYVLVIDIYIIDQKIASDFIGNMKFIDMFYNLVKNVPNRLFVFQWFHVFFFDVSFFSFHRFHPNIRFKAMYSMILVFGFRLWRHLLINKKQTHLWNVMNLLNITSLLEIEDQEVLPFFWASFIFMSFPIQNNLSIVVSRGWKLVPCMWVFHYLEFLRQDV